MAALAVPRLAGTEEAEKAGEELRGRFEERGYEVRELPFEYSALPGAMGVPILGGALLLGSVAGIVLLLTALPIVALVVLALFGAAVARPASSSSASCPACRGSDALAPTGSSPPPGARRAT